MDKAGGSTVDTPTQRIGLGSRVLSVDDLVGNLYRLNSQATMGMGRTDSEAAFQEFLRRIPSASNLAAIAGSAGQLPLVDAMPGSSASLLPVAGTLGDFHGSSGGGGIPRVGSLDFLARLMSPGSAGLAHPIMPASNGMLKPEPAVPLTTGPQLAAAGLTMLGPDYASLAAANGLQPINPAVLHAVPGLTSSAAMAAAVANPLAAAAHLNPVSAAAAALQLQGQLGQLQRMHASSMPPQAPTSTTHTNNNHSASSKSDGEGTDKQENRRARRMLSNRESARRSRRRKQEHLSKLEGELATCQEEKRVFMDRAQALERRCSSIEEENKRLKEENERLRDELHFLRNELSDRKDRGGWRRERDEEDMPYSKRGRPEERGPASRYYSSRPDGGGEGGGRPGRGGGGGVQLHDGGMDDEGELVALPLGRSGREEGGGGVRGSAGAGAVRTQPERRDRGSRYQPPPPQHHDHDGSSQSSQ